MGRPTLQESKDTKAELLQVGLDLIQTRGYNAFSYQDLADRLNIRKASIHYYFPSKEDLGIGLMEHGIERLKAWQQKHNDPNLSALTRLEAYFDYFAMLSASGTKICPCGALMSDWGALPPKLQGAVSKLLTTHREWVKATLESGRKSGEIAKNGTAEEQAMFVFASLQGALQASRAQSSPAYFRAITRQLLSALKA
ncbi:MAG: TetR/AcrR family transcriptional regulator [Bdellovibrionia bacterium]